VNADGTQELIPYSYIDGTTAKALMYESATLTARDNSVDFRDVDSSAWYADAVNFAASHEMFKGVGDGLFDPNGTMTRGMIVQVLANIEKAAGGSASFEDVAAGAWYESAVAWAAEKGIVSGYGDGRFGPQDNITREQMAVILYNYVQKLGYNVTGSAGLDKFSDAESVSAWSKTALEWAVGCGIINGNADGTLNPQGNATRAQVATIMENFTKVLLGVH
ncbi:MAG: S-layer homology domain-containing protein, partial [Anaerovoracaceae bacterium]